MAISLSHAERRIAKRARMLNGLATREILKLTEWPHMIAFAGGMRSPTTFPLAAPLEPAIAVNVAFIPSAPFFALAPLHHYLLAALINAHTRSFTHVLDLDYDR